MALVNPIPNQYVRQGVAFSYTFPSNTFSGTGLVYKSYVNRLLRGRNLPSWLTFNPATRTFSGTATEWWQCQTLQIVVEADAAGTKSYSIFIMHVGQSAQVGTVPWRAGNTPEAYLTLANIAAFDVNTVVPGGFYAIGTDVTRNPLTTAYQSIIDGIRTNGGLPLWIWDNNNGLKAHQVNYFDFTKVNAGETIAIDFANGPTRAFNPQGQLMGEEGKHIFVTNYNVPGFIHGRNWQDFQNVCPIRFSRHSSGRQDRYITVFGQPNNHVPFINLHGIGLKEGILSQVDGPQGHIAHSFLQLPQGTIGFHWKPNTTLTGGDRRPSENVNGWDMNSHHLWIHDNFVSDITHEGIYLGGGGWPGGPIKSYHLNPDGTRQKVLHNGVMVDDYHNIQRFNSSHEYVSIEHNIFLRTGWDPIQTRCVIREHRIMYNYCFESARGDDVNTVQAEGIIVDSTGEIAYNWVEKAWFSSLRLNSIGMMAVHHNVLIEGGQDNYGNPNLSGAPKFGTAIMGSARGWVGDDMPQLYIANYPNYDPLQTYNYDNFQHPVKVKKNGKSFRSKVANNTGHDPETSPDWWEDTREWVSAIMRTDVNKETHDFFKAYNNTLVNNVTNTFDIGISTPAAKRFIKNNLAVNSGSNVISGGSGSDTEFNIAVTGAALTTYFQDPANQDFRLKTGSPAIAAGTDLTAEITGTDVFDEGFKDYSGQPHAATPSVGAFEAGSPVGDHYSFAINGQEFTGGGGGGVVIPPPITINVGPDLILDLPLDNGFTLTAVKSDPARVLDTILWTQTAGNPLTLNNASTLSLTVTDVVSGDYTFQIDTIDEHGQTANDSVNVKVRALSVTSSFRWYIADDANGTNRTPIPDSNVKRLNITPYIGLGKWFQRGVTVTSKSGTILGQENLSSWVQVL